MRLRAIPVYLIPIFAWLLLLPIALKAHTPDVPRRVYVYGSEAVFDFRLHHTLAVVQAALDVNADKLGPIEVRSTAESDLWMNRSRAVASIQRGKDFLHIISSFASVDLDAKLLPIRRSIAGTVLGERIFLVHPARRRELEGISSIGALKKYAIGVGQGWIDGEIMKHAGLRVQTSARYDLLFTMLQGQRFDLLTRAVHEGWDELRIRGFRELDWTGSWALSYPAPFYLYVNKDQKKLAERLEKGLEVMEANGTLDRLFIEHFGPSLLRAGWMERKRFVIRNPYLPVQPPLGFSSWDQWHKKAEGDLARLHKAAQERFQPAWSGLYRPQRLIDQFMNFSVNRTVKFNSTPLLVRAADRPNDTHILAAVLALELALAHPGIKGSPYFQKPVQYLIDKSLDQKQALESLNALNPFMDAVATQTSGERERRYVNAPVDIAQGLMGKRVFVVRRRNLQVFRNVRTVEDLRSFRICVGEDWPDRWVLEMAGVPVVTRRFTGELFEVLLRGECDGLSRAVYEVRDELLGRPSDELDVDPYVLLSYPAAQHLFFARNREDLAEAAAHGLRAIQGRGILHELMEVMYGDSIQYVQMEGRRVLSLTNPQAGGRVGREGLFP